MNVDVKNLTFAESGEEDGRMSAGVWVSSVSDHACSLLCQVKALKEKIEAERGKDNFPVSGQKLIYAGKILQDDTPIKDYKIDEKNFVVVMVSKVRLWAALILVHPLT